MADCYPILFVRQRVGNETALLAVRKVYDKGAFVEAETPGGSDSSLIYSTKGMVPTTLDTNAEGKLQFYVLVGTPRQLRLFVGYAKSQGFVATKYQEGAHTVKWPVNEVCNTYRDAWI